MRMQRVALGLLLGASALAPSPAQAYGGFFGSERQAIRQAGERVILSDNGDGTITAVIQLLYEGPADNFAWLLPITNVPREGELTMGASLAFERLEAATRPRFELGLRAEGTCRSQSLTGAPQGGSYTPSRPNCDESSFLAGCGANGAVNVAAPGRVGAFDWQVISNDPSAPDPVTPALEWLTTNGHDVTPEGVARLRPYLARGMNLLALRLTKGEQSGSIRPIQLTYPAEAPIIPLELTAAAANPNMEVMTWVLSSSRAAPLNYKAIELNEARVNWFYVPGDNYREVVTDAANEAEGRGFVTEFAAPAAQLAGVVWTPREEADWQTIQSIPFPSLEQLLLVTSLQYQAYDGFADALRRGVELDEGLRFEDFLSCPWCSAGQVSISTSEFFAAIDAEVLEPLRRLQALIDAAAYTTRLFTTLSAEEMTVDPAFVQSPELADVNNLHQADRVLECSSNILEERAPWRIDFPQGTTLRGVPYTTGDWPEAADEQPGSFRVLELDDTGSAEVVVDNSGLIGEMLDAYNASLIVVPNQRKAAASDAGGLCSLPLRGPGGAPAPFALGLAALAGASWLRRRR